MLLKDYKLDPHDDTPTGRELRRRRQHTEGILAYLARVRAEEAAVGRGKPLDPRGPTTARPGTPEKIEVMRWRWQHGYALHHPGDERLAIRRGD